MKRCGVCNTEVTAQDGYTEMWADGDGRVFCPVCFIEHMHFVFNIIGNDLSNMEKLSEHLRASIGDEAFAEVRQKAAEAAHRSYERYEKEHDRQEVEAATKKPLLFMNGVIGNA